MQLLVRRMFFVLNLVLCAWLLRNAVGLLMDGSWLPGMAVLGASLFLATAPLSRRVFPCQMGMLVYLVGAIASIVELAWPSLEGGGGPSRWQLAAASAACLLLSGYMLVLAREKANQRAIDQLLRLFLETVDAGHAAATSEDTELASYQLYEVFDTGVISFFHDAALARLQEAGVLDVRVIDAARDVRAAWLGVQRRLDVHDPEALRASEEWRWIASRCKEMSELTARIRR